MVLVVVVVVVMVVVVVVVAVCRMKVVAATAFGSGRGCSRGGEWDDGVGGGGILKRGERLLALGSRVNGSAMSAGLTG